MRLEYWSGTGNRFLIGYGSLDCDLSLSAFTRKICQGEFGLTCDGFVLLEKNLVDQNVDFNWQFYNRDGSMGEMCGNAARCVVSYLWENGLHNTNPLRVRTESGVFSGQMVNGQVEIQMSKLEKMNVGMPHPCFDSGVPHVVVKVEDAFEVDLNLARALRSDPQLGERGANVTFFTPQQKGKIDSCTFERGVEGVTQACGTGAVAAAYCYSLQASGISQIVVTVPGGELGVRFDDGQAFLSGKTLKHFNVELVEI